MRYTKKTIEKYKGFMDHMIQKYDEMTPEQIRAIGTAISEGNGKIGRVLNVSLPAIIACHNCHTADGCDGCAYYCYDVKDCYRHGYKDDNQTFAARARNYVLATKYRDAYFEAIDKAMSARRKNKYFRWHVAGDILDYDYFCRMMDNARRHPDFKIWTYTKCYAYVNRWIRENGPLPDNFKCMFSAWDGMTFLNPWNLPLFACKLEKGNRDLTADDFKTMYKCPGNCDICKAVNRGCIAGENTYADEH